MRVGPSEQYANSKWGQNSEERNRETRGGVRIEQLKFSLSLLLSIFLAFRSGLCQSRHIVGKCYSCSCYLSSEAESDHDLGDPSLATVRGRSSLLLRESALFSSWNLLPFLSLFASLSSFCPRSASRDWLSACVVAICCVIVGGGADWTESREWREGTHWLWNLRDPAPVGHGA